MPRIAFTPHLKQFFDLPDEATVAGGTVADVVRALDARWPGLGFYITDEQGRLRKHVAVWVDGRRIRDRDTLSDPVAANGEVHILQALSGG
ncbi:MAG: MoaD/ThiS family protein [Planctomycetota bacterium]|jgi:molybdopterin converting factor small subunit